jgi:hypothetical protein
VDWLKMIHVITEQTWSRPTGTIDGQSIGPPRLVDSKPSREEAELCAVALAAEYDQHNYNDEGDDRRGYWWGRDKNSQEVHRFVVRPAAPMTQKRL